MAEQVRLGIVGLGAQGSTYARLITDGMVPNMKIGAICTSNPAKAEVVGSTYPGVGFYVDYSTMLGSGDVDAVVICVPPYLHPEMAITALERDIHALVEKPAGVYTKQVRELNAYAATKPGLTFAIMFNQRNNPLYQRIKEIIDGGELGNIRRSDWIITTWWRPQGYYDQSAWRATWGGEGGGVLVNQASHQLDLWQWICGMPRSVYASVGYGFQRDTAVEDDVTAIVKYDHGATGVFVTAVHDLIGTDRFEILGDSGKIVVDNSKTATVIRLSRPEREISDQMSSDDVQRLYAGSWTSAPSLRRKSSSSTRLGVANMLACCRTSPPTFSTAPLSSHPVRTASTGYSWPMPSTSPAGPAMRCRSTSTMTST
jgi:predicted dehydrogenase